MDPFRRHALRAAALLVPACAGAARAGDGDLIRLSYTFPQPEAAAPAAEPTPNPAGKSFGTAGQSWFTFGPGVAYDFGENTDINFRAAYSYFLVDHFEVSVELNAWYHSQEFDDAMSLNPALVFRWHVPLNDRWTVYVDAGVGVLFATDAVPDDGTNVNFTPRVGTGLTWAISDSVRLQGGLRWHHISNARITGDRNNPARDAPMVYLGVMIPF